MNTTVIVRGLLLGLVIVLTACSDRNNPVEVETHPEGWLEPTSAVFHGKMVLESARKANNCASCHGEDFKGGTTGVSCVSSGCHPAYPHPEGFAEQTTGGKHVDFIMDQAKWNLETCQACHGSDYAGNGTAAKNCRTCHTEPDGPEACNTCHGNDENNAPPKDLFGHVNTTFAGVGAHQHHVEESEITDVLTPSCTHCHVEPSAYSDPTHVDDDPGEAELTFDAFATHDGALATAFDPLDATCSNVYCHGGFSFAKADSDNPWGYAEDTIRGENLVMRWTEVGTGQDACGTCHGLPPAGHIPVVTCEGCHPRVVDADFNIINKTLHLNGEKDLF